MIAVLAAMAEELAPLRRGQNLEEVYSNKVVRVQSVGHGGRQLLLVQTGIGKANAAAAVTIVAEKFKPTALIDIGSAGGFSGKVRVGDIVVGTDTAYHDVDATCFGYKLGQVPKMPPAYPADGRLLAAAHSLAELPEFAGIVRFGRILTSDSFMSDPGRARSVAAAFPEAFASDMEGAAAAQAAYNLDIPFLNVRSISDIGGEDAAQSFDDNIDLAAERAARFFTLLVENI